MENPVRENLLWSRKLIYQSWIRRLKIFIKRDWDERRIVIDRKSVKRREDLRDYGGHNWRDRSRFKTPQNERCVERHWTRGTRKDHPSEEEERRKVTYACIFALAGNQWLYTSETIENLTNTETSLSFLHGGRQIDNESIVTHVRQTRRIVAQLLQSDSSKASSRQFSWWSF